MTAVVVPEQVDLLEDLRAGNEDAFAVLVERHHASMLRLARLYVADNSTAEEVVQDAWLGVLTGLGRFEGRSSLRTWIFRILINRAKTRGGREARNAGWVTLDDDGSVAVESERFLDPSHPSEPGHWASPPSRWTDTPETRLLSAEVRASLEAAIEGLAPLPQAVLTLRDVEGCSAAEACNILGLSETNQRVILHRARSKVRRALESYFERQRSA